MVKNINEIKLKKKIIKKIKIEDEKKIKKFELAAKTGDELMECLSRQTYI